MKSLITILLFAYLGTLFAQDCNNPLLAFFGLNGLDNPQSGANLPYCAELQSGNTCCSANTVAGFQDRLDNLIEKLNNYAAAKDLYFAQLKNVYFNSYQNVLGNLNGIQSTDLATVTAANNTLGTQLQDDINLFNQLSNLTQNINNQFNTALNDYQAARNTCYTTALQIQSSAWCLACDPNYGTSGVNGDGSVTFSDGLCEDLSNACWQFFNQTSAFNPLIKAREEYWRLLAISSYLDSVATNGQVTPLTIAPNPFNPLSTQQQTALPDQWVPGSEELAFSSEQCQDLWSGDGLLKDLLAIGNPMFGNENEVAGFEEENFIGETPIVTVTVNTDTSTRLLQDAFAGSDGTWAPDLTATGLNFTDLRLDPGDYWSASNYSTTFNVALNTTAL